ncbi:Membrane fusogenic activity [Legionella massiliensis]|uniref:Ubiquinone biosynthesis accessory factor UbiK n=1 Tax=Legionella massiliensis TaxID=1034943 RepID=A0A078KR50_9GAMM|nr:accessory factor UbiK family protein [Legionella massiliensis]CDZ76900.1 Membrane fusogenic activity [Legionella massiliensis]CEE12638.1 Membrane fusogenic activity [Legionella massiliensis]
MFDPKQFDDLAKKLFATLPNSFQNLETEIQQKFKEILQATFARMDLVTREEFDVQTKVLARTREKLDLLQGQVEGLLAKDVKKKKSS